MHRNFYICKLPVHDTINYRKFRKELPIKGRFIGRSSITGFAEQLTWKSSEVLDSERIALMQATVQKEQEEYQVLFAKKMEELI